MMRCGMDDSMNRRTDEALDVAFLEHLSSVAREREAAARVEHTSAHVFVHVGLPLRNTWKKVFGADQNSRA